MRIKKIQIENLRSYEKQEINFPKGSTLLSGDIGTGKTSILLAIEFALFGLQPGQKGTSLLRSGTETAKVVLEFEIEGQNIIIERTLKKAKTINQDYASIKINDERFEGSVTEIKNKVLGLLEYPSEFSKKTNLLYKFTVYTPQEEMKQIILEPKDIRLNTLRHVFGIDKYKRIEENSLLLTSKLREKIRINEGMLLDLELNKENLKQKQEEFIELKEKSEKAMQNHEKAAQVRVEKEKTMQEIQEKINEKKILENEKSKSQILISEKNQQITTLNNSIKTLAMQVEEARKISFSEQDFNTLNERIKFQENKHDELQREYINIISNIKTQELKKKETEELKNKISRLQRCPTCLQEVSEGYKSNIFSRVDSEAQEIQKNINELNLKKNQLTEQIDSVKKNLENFKKQKSESELLKLKSENLKEKEQRIIEIEAQKSSIIKDLEMLKKLVIQLEISIQEYLRYDQIFMDISGEVEKARQNENNFAIKKAEINKEIQFSEKQILDLEKQIKQKEKLKENTEKLRQLEYWVSEKFLELVLFTEKQVMFTLKEEFSKLFSRWFAILVSDELSAKLDDNFSPVIEQQDYELDYSFLSGGERTAIALAYRLSLNQVINSLLSKIKTRNLVILDEPTDGFSSQQLDKMRDVLQQLKTEQLIIVSHEPKIEGFVDNIIKFTKEAGITKVGE
jgi:exonuclease SbcC